MLAIWNRRELVTVLTMQEQSDILSALRDAGLDYTVKAIDRSSPSALNPGTRADFGTMGMSSGAQYEYIIYVNKRDYDAARDAAGLPKSCTFHSLRHTHATWCLANGVDLKTLSERLGHANEATTLRLYAHCLPGRDAAAAETFAAFAEELGRGM